MDRNTTKVTGIAAFLATQSTVKFYFLTRPFGHRTANAMRCFIFFFTVWADLTNQSLCQHRDQRSTDQIGRNPQINQPGDGTGRIIGMQRLKN